MLKNFAYLIFSVVVFFLFTLLYGSILNIREKPLNEILKERNISELDNPKIVVKVSENVLMLFNGDELIKKYKINLGKSNFKLADSRKNYITTPKGIFSVCDFYPDKKYYKSFLLNYPDSLTILKAFKLKLIDAKSLKKMLNDKKYGCKGKFDKKIFGPPLTIHGFGKVNYILKNLPFVFNWTNGSIALSNEDLDEISPYLQIGTKIKITH